MTGLAGLPSPPRMRDGIRLAEHPGGRSLVLAGSEGPAAVLYSCGADAHLNLAAGDVPCRPAGKRARVNDAFLWFDDRAMSGLGGIDSRFYQTRLPLSLCTRVP